MENLNVILVLLAIFVRLLHLLLSNVKLVLIQLPRQALVHLAMMASSANSKSKHQTLSISSAQPVSIASMILETISNSSKGLVPPASISP